jgi:hypothetical protein
MGVRIGKMRKRRRPYGENPAAADPSTQNSALQRDVAAGSFG